MHKGPKGDSKSHCFSHKRFKVRDCFGFWDIDPVVIRQLINSDRTQSDNSLGVRLDCGGLFLVLKLRVDY